MSFQSPTRATHIVLLPGWSPDARISRDVWVRLWRIGFAAQACAVNAGLGLNTDNVNPNGGAIALGHSIGATGAIILIKALYELERIGGQFGRVTMCIGGGQGIALAIERLN